MKYTIIFFACFYTTLSFASENSWQKTASIEDVYYAGNLHELNVEEFKELNNRELLNDLERTSFVPYDEKKYGSFSVKCVTPKKLIALRGVTFPGASISVMENSNNVIVGASSVSAGPIKENTIVKVAVVACLQRDPQSVFVDYGRAGIDSDFRK